jgi:hypothetical protein
MSEECELDAQGTVLLQSLKDEFPSLPFDYKNGAIRVCVIRSWCAIADKSSGDWVVDEDIKPDLHNFVLFKQLEAKLLAEDRLKYSGAYLLVNSPTCRIVYELFDPAFRNKAPHGYLDRLGREDCSDDVLVL